MLGGDILRALSLFLSGLTTGGMVFMYATIAPVMAELTIQESFKLHAAMLRFDPDRYIKPAGVVAFLSTIAVLFVDTDASDESLILNGVGVLGFLGVVAVSEGFNVPVNRKVAKWPEDEATYTYAPMRARWLQAHAWRTWAGILALAALAASAVVR